LQDLNASTFDVQRHERRELSCYDVIGGTRITWHVPAAAGSRRRKAPSLALVLSTYTMRHRWRAYSRANFYPMITVTIKGLRPPACVIRTGCLGDQPLDPRRDVMLWRVAASASSSTPSIYSRRFISSVCTASDFKAWFTRLIQCWWRCSTFLWRFHWMDAIIPRVWVCYNRRWVLVYMYVTTVPIESPSNMHSPRFSDLWNSTKYFWSCLWTLQCST